MLKKLPSEKISGTKNVLFSFASPNNTVLLLICDSYTSRNTSFVSRKLCVRFSIFRFVSFLLTFTFLFNKQYSLFDLKAS